MAKKIIKTVFQFRRSTTAEWELNKDIIPAAGEPCYDLDLKTLRIGDGVSHYKDLPIIGNVGTGDASGLEEEIEAIKNLMETLQTDIDNVETSVSGIQEQVGETNIVEVQESVTQMTENINNLATQIGTTSTEIVTIQQTLDTKADAETVSELQTVIKEKADAEAVKAMSTELKTYVDEKIKTVEVSGNIDDGEI